MIPFRCFYLILLFFICHQAIKAQLLSDSILIDNHYRTFHFNKPLHKHSSLLFVLHGSGADATQLMKRAEGLESIASDENIILVYPDAYKTYWNECRKEATTISNLENINDNYFFSEMIHYFQKNYNADETGCYAVGFSGGGHMAFKLGITMPGHFRGITVVAANLPTADNMDCEEMNIPVAIVIVNGTADPVNPFEGGLLQSPGLVLGSVRSTDESCRYWTTINGLKKKPKKSIVPDKNPADDISVEKYVFAKRKKPGLVLYKVNNGRHGFPPDLDVFIESWIFFKSTWQTKPKLH